MPEWQELAKDRRKGRKMLKSIRIRRWFVLQVQGVRVGSFAQRYHVDQPRTQIKRKGNSGDDLHRTAGPSLRQWERLWDGGSEPAAQPPSPAGGVRPARGVYKTRQDRTELASFFFLFGQYANCGCLAPQMTLCFVTSALRTKTTTAL